MTTTYRGQDLDSDAVKQGFCIQSVFDAAKVVEAARATGEEVDGEITKARLDELRALALS